MINIIKKFIIVLFVITAIPCFSFATKDNNYFKTVQDPENVYIVEIQPLKNKHYLIPYISDTRETNKEVFDKTGAKLCVNTGFFDFQNNKSVSYITIYGETAADPTQNDNLMSNKALKPYMDKILNRSEFRILEDKNKKIKYDIAPHNEPIPDGYKLKHAIQGGPGLYPELRLEEEFFILVKKGKTVSESAAALIKRERTAIGIKDNKVYLFIVTTPAAMTLGELAELTKNWGMEKAMGFDGGGSTSLDTKHLHIASENGTKGRKVKSFLLLF